MSIKNFSSVKEKVALTLLEKSLKMKEYKGRKLFFIDKKTFKELKKLHNELVKELFEEYRSRKKARDYVNEKIFKIINPSNEPVKFIDFYDEESFVSVSDKKKILEKYIDGEFLRFSAQEMKNAEKFIKENGLDEVEAAKFREKIRKKIEEYKKIYEDIKNNPDKYDIVYSDIFYSNRVYPAVTFYSSSHNRNLHKILSPSLNVIYHSDNIERKKRKTSKLAEKLKNYENFGKLFFKKKE